MKKLFEIIDDKSIIFSGYSEEETKLAYDIMTTHALPELDVEICGENELDIFNIKYEGDLKLVQVLSVNGINKQ